MDDKYILITVLFLLVAIVIIVYQCITLCDIELF